MQKIKLKELIKKCALDEKQLAQDLFPGNSYPFLALKRVMKGLSVLNADQISKLSLLTGLSINELFIGGEWKAARADGKCVFTCGEYEAILDASNGHTKIYHNKSLFHESVFHKNSIPLGEYIESLNSIIIKNQKQ